MPFLLRREDTSLVATHLKLVELTTVKLTVARNPSGRKPNAELRTREHLTPGEVDTLMNAAKGNRHGHRDATLILVAFCHGLRAGELCELQWNQVDFASGILHVRRIKQGTPSTHALVGIELRALRKLKHESNARQFVFTSERGSPFDTAGFAAMIRRAGVKAGLELKVHPHMLRHACGYKLANDGVDTRSLQGYLGHRNMQHTARYAALAPNRFKNFWKD